MNINKLNLNLLRSLDVMLREKNITQAGKKLFLTQSAMSNSLNQCREFFHDELLIRGPNDMELTPLAREIQKKLNTIFLDLNDLLASVEEFNPQRCKRKFVIGFYDRGWASQTLLAPLVELLEKEAPHITIDINYVDYEIRSSLKKNEILPMHQERYMDIIIGFFIAPPPQYRMQQLFATDICCAARKGHPYLTSPTMENYLAAKHLVVSQPFYGQPNKIDQLLASTNRKRNIAMRLADIYQAAFVLPHTNYLATLPMDLIVKCNNAAIATAPTPFKEKIHNPVSMIWDDRQSFDKAHTWLRDAIERISKKVSILSYDKL